MRWLLVLALGCTAAPPDPVETEAPAASSADVEAQAQALQDQAMEAYQRGDYAVFTDRTAQALALADDDNGVRRYNLACGHALLGHRDEALAELRTLLAARIDHGADRDSDFASLWADPEFVAVSEQFAALFPPVHTSAVERTIDELGLAPEGIAHHDGRIFLSSMTHGAVYEVDADGHVTRFAEVKAGEVPLSVLGLAVDVDGRRLWAVGIGDEMATSYLPEHDGLAGVFAFDLQTGEPVESRMFEGKHPSGGFNDLALARDGTVYVSGGGLHVAGPGEAVTFLPTSEKLTFTNGLALLPDESALYVAAGPRGIARVSLPEGDVSWVQRSPDQQIRGFDGLYYTDERLVGVQHGQGGRWRVLQLDLDPTGLKVERAHVLEQKHPDLTLSTTGYVDGASLVYLALGPVPPGREDQVPKSAGVWGGPPTLLRAPLVPTAAR